MTAARWWEADPDATKPDEVAAAAKRAGVYVGAMPDGTVRYGSEHMTDVPMVIAEAHGGPWAVYPDPYSILGWVAGQVEFRAAAGIVSWLEGTTGWLGAADLEADEVIANLLNASELPTDLYLRGFVSTRRVRGGESR